MAAISHGDIDTAPARALDSLDTNMAALIRSRAESTELCERLIAALRLGGPDFQHLAAFVDRMARVVEPLRLREMLQTDTDVLGIFYEAFLRYGYDNNALGIVFTPRHITRFCVDLTDAGPFDAVFDPAAGTGGFLVAALERIGAATARVRGFETNSTTWALANLNLIFRGMPAGAIVHASCFDTSYAADIRGKFTRAYLNPPFSQAHEAEVAFIGVAMEALAPAGLAAAVVYAGVFADDEHLVWRREFLQKHSVLAVISLPEELFYPTAAPTSILVARAHVPHENQPVLMARVWNDGYEKRKGRRVAKAGEQLSEVRAAFTGFMSRDRVESELCATIDGSRLANGAEWSPQHWLPQPPLAQGQMDAAQSAVVHAVFAAAVQYPILAWRALGDFTGVWRATLPALPYDRAAALSEFFELANGRSAGEKNYIEGDVPYVSSGAATNSIVSLVNLAEAEQFLHGGLTVTAFGQGALQPWSFAARGNGGSAVRVLLPRFAMSVRELVWFAAQINVQRWRFFYARMAIKSRLAAPDFRVQSPPAALPDTGPSLAQRLQSVRATLRDAATL